MIVKLKHYLWSAACALIAAGILVASVAAVPALGQQAGSSSQDVLTYHGDNLRTGWFSSETQLTVANVNPTTFGLLHTVVLDARVDAEPLVVNGQAIQGKGTHDVVYVATEGNSVYAIDANDGSILWQTHFGIPVPYQYKSYDDNVFPVMGILSTPVIDRNTGIMYFVADSLNGSKDVFRLHAISLSSGRDVVSPVTIQFSQTLSDGSKWTFNPKYHLQRPALLEANGGIYVAFGSNGDINPDESRGSIVRYDAATPIRLTGQLTNKLDPSYSHYYLSSIWQSGYGPASDQNGDIYFATGNSDPGDRSYSPPYNYPESMLRFSGDLRSLKDSFTPYDYFHLDQVDHDLGSGGILVLPDQAGSTPHLAIGGGKDGRAFLFNRDNMGGYTEGGPDNVVETVTMGACWCGPAYFSTADGVGHILTGGRNGVISWKVQITSSVRLILETSTYNSPVQGLPDNGGVFPVVSSNGTTPGSAIAWFVQRPTSSSDQNPGTAVTLRAFDATNLQQQLLSIPAGTWTHAVNSSANVVPTVSKGKVFVASNQQLRIFGLLGQQKASDSKVPAKLLPSAPDVSTCPADAPAPVAAKGTGPAVHEFYGTICQSGEKEIRLALRTGRAIRVSIEEAFTQHAAILLTAGRTVRVLATIDEDGVAHASSISRSHIISPLTPPDR